MAFEYLTWQHKIENDNENQENIKGVELTEKTLHIIR